MRKLISGLFAAALFAAPALAETTVLKGMTLIDGTGKPAQPNSALVMTDGKVAWVGPVAQLKAPAGAKTVDLAGKFVIPGLIDSHVHIGIMHDQTQDIKYYTRENVEADLKTYAAYGVTAVQVLGTDKDMIFDIRKEERAGRPKMARVFTAGQGEVFKGGYGGVFGLNVPVSTPEEARKSVDEQAAKGVDFIKLWMDDERKTIPVKMPYPVSTAIIDEAHKHHLRAVAHIFYLADAKELVREGIDGFAHMVRDQPVDNELLSMMKAKGTWMVSATLSREMAYSLAIMPWLNDPFFVRGVTPGTLTALRSMAREQAVVLGPTRFPGLPYEKKVFWDMDRTIFQALQNYQAMVKAGINTGLGTDSGPNGRFPGFNAHEEMQLQVLAGRTPMDAIKSATSDNARWLGDSSIGTLEQGKWADLVVLEKNPLDDIRNTHAINSVYLAGNSVPTVWQICRDRPASACTGSALLCVSLGFLRASCGLDLSAGPSYGGLFGVNFGPSIGDQIRKAIGKWLPVLLLFWPLCYALLSALAWGRALRHGGSVCTFGVGSVIYSGLFHDDLWEYEYDLVIVGMFFVAICLLLAERRTGWVVAALAIAMVMILLMRLPD